MGRAPKKSSLDFGGDQKQMQKFLLDLILANAVSRVKMEAYF